MKSSFGDVHNLSNVTSRAESLQKLKIIEILWQVTAEKCQIMDAK